MAQGFYHHFGKDDIGVLGCDTMIATADFDGVSFAAIKALEKRTSDLKLENEQLKGLAVLSKEVNELKAMLSNYSKFLKTTSNKTKLYEIIKSIIPSSYCLYSSSLS